MGKKERQVGKRRGLFAGYEKKPVAKRKILPIRQKKEK